MTERTNRQLCDEFRALLTGQASDAFQLAAEKLDRLGSGPLSGEDILYATKPWRGELWKAFREIEDRLCPVDADMRKKQ